MKEGKPVSVRMSPRLQRRVDKYRRRLARDARCELSRSDAVRILVGYALNVDDDRRLAAHKRSKR